MTKRITILGAGFAALTAVRELRRLDRSVEITLIAPAPEFVYYPSLIWVPSDLRTGDDLRFDLGRFLERYDVRFHRGRVTSVAECGRRVDTDSGEVRNDGLLVASGGRFIRKLPGIEHALTLCAGIAAAQSIRDRLRDMDGGTIAVGFGGNPNEPSAMRGGPMFELLFGIDTWLRRQNRRERFRLVFFNPAPQPGKRLGEKAVAGLLREMAKRGIETHLGYKLTGFEAAAVKTEGGDFAADLILFMPGMTGPAWLQDSAWLPISDGGLLRADTHCKVPETNALYVAGDSGSYPGPDWMPKQAHLADLQAKAAAANLIAELNGGQPTATFRPELICIVDTLDKGILVYRDPQRSLVFQAGWLHWAKRLFEWYYLRPLRRRAS